MQRSKGLASERKEVAGYISVLASFTQDHSGFQPPGKSLQSRSVCPFISVITWPCYKHLWLLMQIVLEFGVENNLSLRGSWSLTQHVQLRSQLSHFCQLGSIQSRHLVALPSSWWYWISGSWLSVTFYIFLRFYFILLYVFIKIRLRCCYPYSVYTE